MVHDLDGKTPVISMEAIDTIGHSNRGRDARRVALETRASAAPDDAFHVARPDWSTWQVLVPPREPRGAGWRAGRRAGRLRHVLESEATDGEGRRRRLQLLLQAQLFTSITGGRCRIEQERLQTRSATRTIAGSTC